MRTFQKPQASALLFFVALLSPLSVFADWEVKLLTPNQDLYGLWGRGDEVFAVGARGSIQRSKDNGKSWASVASGTTETLFSIWGNTNIIYAAGANGTILRSTDGDSWQSIPTNQSLALRSIWGSSDTDVYAVGEQGLLLHSSDGLSFQKLTSPTQVLLSAVWGSSANDVFVIGEQGVLLRSADQGKTWVQEQSGTTEVLRGVWGSGPDNIFIVGYHQTILRSIDGGKSWQNQSQSSQDWLATIIGFPGGELYAAGARGLVVRSSDGVSWKQQTNNDSSAAIYSAWGNSPKSLMMVGKGGALLRLKPPKPTLTLLSEDDSANGAEASIDGKPAGTIPLTASLEPGSHLIELSRKDFHPKRENIELAEGENRSIPMALEPIKTVSFRVEGLAGAMLTVDNMPLGVLPLQIEKLTVGEHTFLVEKAGYKPRIETREITEENLVLVLELEKVLEESEVAGVLRPKILYSVSGATGALAAVSFGLMLSRVRLLQDATHTAGDGSPGGTEAAANAAAADTAKYQTQGKIFALTADLGAIAALASGGAGLFLQHKAKNPKPEQSQAPAGPK